MTLTAGQLLRIVIQRPRIIMTESTIAVSGCIVVMMIRRHMAVVAGDTGSTFDAPRPFQLDVSRFELFHIF